MAEWITGENPETSGAYYVTVQTKHKRKLKIMCFKDGKWEYMRKSRKKHKKHKVIAWMDVWEMYEIPEGVYEGN